MGAICRPKSPSNFGSSPAQMTKLLNDVNLTGDCAGWGAECHVTYSGLCFRSPIVAFAT